MKRRILSVSQCPKIRDLGGGNINEGPGKRKEKPAALRITVGKILAAGAK